MNLSDAKMTATYRQHSAVAALTPLQSSATMPSPTLPQRISLPCRELKKSVSTSLPRRELNPVQKTAGAVLDAMERLLILPMEAQRPLPPTINPATQLAGNFSPVTEETPATPLLEIEGAIPAGLGAGTYVRNGANPHLSPAGGHHLFDGDGMLHAVTFGEDGAANYAARFTRTYRLEQESAAGRPLFPKAIGELHGHTGLARLFLYYMRGLFGLVDLNQGMGVANAGVIAFAGKLLAMSEDDLPYAVDITAAGDLTTVGRYDFNGQLSSTTTSMIAHPKLDPVTGEMLTLSYDVVKKPYLKYFKFSPAGERQGPEVEIALDRPVMVHDFAITENFVVLPDQQVVFDLRKIFDGCSPVYHDAGKPCRFGLLPRDDETDGNLQWIEVPNCFCFHLWNAWEDGNDVVVIASCMTPADSIFNDRPEALTSELSEIRLNRISGTSTVRPIVTGVNLEMGTVNKNYVGRKSKYTYMAVAEPWPKVSGIAKVDVSSENSESAVVGKYMYPEGCYGGEPLFVPRSAATKNGKNNLNSDVTQNGKDGDTVAEDDGYILSFIHNEITDESSLLILDAASPSLQTLASIKLPSRVPFGFHGTFVQH